MKHNFIYDTEALEGIIKLYKKNFQGRNKSFREKCFMSQNFYWKICFSKSKFSGTKVKHDIGECILIALHKAVK